MFLGRFLRLYIMRWQHWVLPTISRYISLSVGSLRLLSGQEATRFAKAVCACRGKRFRMTRCSCERLMMVGRFHTVKCCLHCVNVLVMPGGDSLHGQEQSYLCLTVWSSGTFSLKVAYATKPLLAPSVMPV